RCTAVVLFPTPPLYPVTVMIFIWFTGYLVYITSLPDIWLKYYEAIAALLDKLDDGEDLGEAIAHRQRIRQQELESGALVNPSSRKKK
ncbi:MAG: hypothetical protein ACRCZS_04635, partial [Chroococcidiopsis sp.]